jgi:hypothetical protein
MLDPKYFGGGGDLPPDLTARLLTTGVNDEVTTPLTTMGWQGELVAGVCLSLSPDGEDVQAARFFLRGALCPEPISIKANLLWRAAADINLSITLPPAQVLRLFWRFIVQRVPRAGASHLLQLRQVRPGHHAGRLAHPQAGQVLPADCGPPGQVVQHKSRPQHQIHRADLPRLGS